MSRWTPSAAIPLVWLCLSPLAGAAILPTDLEPKIGTDYQPVGSEEREIWESLERAEETIRASPQRMVAPELEAYTHAVVERLIGRPAPDLRIYLVHDATPNAAMLPSGMMIVNSGLLVRVHNEAQLAAVLGHEAGHYFRRHALDLHRDTRRTSAMASAAASELSRYGDAYNAWFLINQAIMMSRPRFSRDLEAEADAYGLMLMARAGYPPPAASEMWGQLVDERRASAAARHKRYRDGTSSELSTHPPTERRLADLIDTANHLARNDGLSGSKGREEWAAVIRPYQAMLLREQVYLNNPGASLYLLESLARDGWTGLLRFNEGEVYRLRNANGDDRRAAAAYAAAVAQPDAPAEAWRGHGYALLEAGSKSEAYEALDRYLEMQPDAPDAAMIRVMRIPAAETSVSGGQMTMKPGSSWKKLPASANQTRWEDVWTWSGPQRDRVTLINGLPDGKAIINQQEAADQQVPLFRSDMTVQDLASLLEVAYRVKGVTAFSMNSIEPVEFMGGRGVRLRYDYASGIIFPKRGSCVMRVIGEKLYAMKLEGVAVHFDEVVPEFDKLVRDVK